MKPTVTIIMATYNRAHYIVESIKSIQAQTYENWECLIIDDGGTDSTAEVLAPILIKDNRFSFLKRPNNYAKGLPGCRNYGLDLAKGDYIIFFDDDDIAHPQNLELCVSEFKTKTIDFCRYIRTVFMGDFHYNFDMNTLYSSYRIDKNDIKRIITHELPFNSCAVMWRKACFLTDQFNDYLMYAEEWELYSRLIAKGFEGISINKILFYGRKHVNSNTGEFYNNDPLRIQSKNDATILVFNSLVFSNVLTPFLFKYLTSIPIAFRDKKSLDKMLRTPSVSTRSKVHTYIRYFAYPLWKAIRFF